jgi:hypothetical protein
MTKESRGRKLWLIFLPLQATGIAEDAASRVVRHKKLDYDFIGPDCAYWTFVAVLPKTLDPSID